MVVFLWLLLLQVDPGKEIDELARSLGSDAPEERDRATERLKEIGPPASPTLQHLAKAGEGEIRARAREILVYWERMERVWPWRPSERRTTVDLRDVPLSEALAKVLHPLGLTGLRAEGALKDRKVTLSLDRARFWETVEGLEKAAQVRVLTTVGPVWEKSFETRRESGNAAGKVVVLAWGSRRVGDVQEHALHPTVWLSPGSWITSGRLAEVEVIGDTGKAVECRVEEDLQLRRQDGLFATAEMGAIFVSPKEFQGLKQATVRGTAILRFPRDIRRYEPDKLLAKVELEGGYVQLSELKERTRGDWSVGIAAARTGGPIVVLMSVVDAEGKWLGDLPRIDVEANTSMGMGTSIELNRGVPARLVVVRALGEDEMRVPFSFQLPVPE